MREIPRLCVAGLFLLVPAMAQSALADAAADLKQAEELRNKGQHAQAEQLYKSVLSNATAEQADLVFEARKKLPGLYLATGQRTEAKAAVEELLTEHADREFLPHAIHEIVEQARDLDKTAEVRRVYQEVLQTQSQQRHKLWLKMGLALANVYSGDDQAVEAGVKDIVARHSSHQWVAEALAQTGWAYDKLGRYDKARPLYAYVVDNWPEKPRAMYAHTALVQDCIRLRDKGAAKARLEQMVQRYASQGDIPNVLTQIGRGYRDAGMYEEAKQVSKYVLDNHPGNGYCVWAQRDIILSEIALDAQSSAEQQLSRLLDRYGDNANLPPILNEVAQQYRRARAYGNVVRPLKQDSFMRRRG